MKLKKCRNCQGKKLTKLFSLGKLSYTGKFPKNIKINNSGNSFIVYVYISNKLFTTLVSSISEQIDIQFPESPTQDD